MSEPIKAGTPSVSRRVLLLDTDGLPKTGVAYNAAGLAVWYQRHGAGPKTTITLASLASLTAAYSSGGWYEIGDGYYRLDIPDAAIATGATEVTIGGTCDTGVLIGPAFRLQTIDDQDAVRLGLTALPNAAANAVGGLPVLDANSRISANVTAMAAGVITAASIAANAFASAKFAADFFTSIITAVWTTAADRTLSAFGFNVTLAALQPNYAPAKAGDAMALTGGERTTLVGLIEAEIADDATGAAVKQAIIDKLIENLPDLDDLTLAAIATSVWSSASRTLTDKVGFALTAGEHTSIATAVRTNLDATILNVNASQFAGQTASLFVSNLSMGSGVAIKSNVAAWEGSADAVMTQPFTLKSYNEVTGEWDDGATLFLPFVGSMVSRIEGYPTWHMFHEEIGSPYIQIHGHVHGFSAGALIEARDAVRTELAPQLAIVDNYGTMIVDAAIDGAYEFTAPAVANVAVNLTQENIDDIVAGIAATGLSTELVEKLAQADVQIDYSVSPALVIWYEKGTAVEIMRKQAYDRNGSPITSKLQQLGTLTHVASP